MWLFVEAPPPVPLEQLGESFIQTALIVGKFLLSLGPLAGLAVGIIKARRTQNVQLKKDIDAGPASGPFIEKVSTQTFLVKLDVKQDTLDERLKRVEKMTDKLYDSMLTLQSGQHEIQTSVIKLLAKSVAA